MTHAVIYDRASTNLQKDNYSRVNAREYGIRIAEQNGFTWEYVKEIGSGTTLTGRPEMMKILDRIAAGEIQIIIVQELDRLARPEEPVIYSTIRNTIMQYNVIIYTHTSQVDLNDDDDDFVADITMSVAKKERRRTLKRMRRGMKARAESGKFACGPAGMGYVVTGSGSNSDLEVDPEGAKLVKLIFDTLETTDGNLHRTAQQLNEMGYRGSWGGAFRANTLKRVVERKLFIGILETSLTEQVFHRPDLQIITIEQFEKVNKMLEKRSDKSKNAKGVKGRYIFTGFVACGNCGGTMVGARRTEGDITYQCVARRHYGKTACSASKAYAEHLILPPVVEFLTELIHNQIDLQNSLNEATAKYGKSITEEALEAAIQGELVSVKAGKQRLVDAISTGILTADEAGAKLAELREQEQRLTIEVAGITEKTEMLEEWQRALDSLKDVDKNGIAYRLYNIAERMPVAFRQLLGLVFEPNSLQVRTGRIKGNLKWTGYLDDYQLTEAMQELQNGAVSFNTKSRNRVRCRVGGDTMRKRILVVDDVPDWQAQLQAILKSEYDVITVDTYDAALEAVKERQIELAIVDLRLSPTDENDRQGLKLLEALARQRINAVVLTGYSEAEIKEEAEEKYHAFDFIDKSALANNFQRLLEVVREVFSLLESKDKAKKQAIRAASALQSVSFTDELASWPLRKFRNRK